MAQGEIANKKAEINPIFLFTNLPRIYVKYIEITPMITNGNLATNKLFPKK